MFGEGPRTGLDSSAKRENVEPWKNERLGLSLRTVYRGERWQSVALANVIASAQMVAGALRALMIPQIAIVSVLVD